MAICIARPCDSLRRSYPCHKRFHTNVYFTPTRRKTCALVQFFLVQLLAPAGPPALTCVGESVRSIVHRSQEARQIVKRPHDTDPSNDYFTRINESATTLPRGVTPFIYPELSEITASTACSQGKILIPTVPDDEKQLAVTSAANRLYTCYEEAEKDPVTDEDNLWRSGTGVKETAGTDFVKPPEPSTIRSTGYGLGTSYSDRTCLNKKVFSVKKTRLEGCALPRTAGASTAETRDARSGQPAGSFHYKLGADAGAGVWGKPPDSSAEKQLSGLDMRQAGTMESTCSLWEGTYEQRRKAFLRRYSQTYNFDVESAQARELHRFKGQVYLDYAGSAVYEESQLWRVFKDLTHNAYGNIHSRNPSSRKSEEKLNEARHVVKAFFDAPDSKFTVIFTSGATGALKLVGESFQFAKGLSSFYYLRINHNSVLGIREYAYTKGAKSIKAVAEEDVERLLLQREKATEHNKEEHLSSHFHNALESRPKCLFAFPAKDNWNGKFYPLNWVQRVKKFGLTDDGCKWYVLLDAAAYSATTPLSLSKYPADFVTVSFYKIFGYPTGIGALIARTEDACTLQRIYWGGGSVAASVCDSRWHKRKADFSLQFEDGTLSFLAIVGSIYGFHMIQAIGLEKIHRHVAALTEHLYERLVSLKHSSGARVVVVYWNEPTLPSGGIVTFNLLRPDGRFVPFTQVETAAAEAGIHLRTGCFCNPGGCQDYLGLTAQDIIMSSANRQSCSDPLPQKPTENLFFSRKAATSHAEGTQSPLRKPLGSVRVSLGYVSTFADVDKFIMFVKEIWVK